jgi:hypothetical protein
MQKAWTAPAASSAFPAAQGNRPFHRSHQIRIDANLEIAAGRYRRRLPRLSPRAPSVGSLSGRRRRNSPSRPSAPTPWRGSRSCRRSPPWRWNGWSGPRSRKCRPWGRCSPPCEHTPPVLQLRLRKKGRGSPAARPTVAEWRGQMAIGDGVPLLVGHLWIEPAGAEGFPPGRQLSKLGMHAQDTSELSLMKYCPGWQSIGRQGKVAASPSYRASRGADRRQCKAAAFARRVAG